MYNILIIHLLIPRNIGKIYLYYKMIVTFDSWSESDEELISFVSIEYSK